jgi:hypothetical protein
MCVTGQHYRENLDGSECLLQGAGGCAATPRQSSANMIAIQQAAIQQAAEWLQPLLRIVHFARRRPIG